MLDPTNPPERGPDPSPTRVVVATQATDAPARHRIVLNESALDEQSTPACAAVPTTPSRVEPVAPRPQHLTCLGLVDRVIGDWAPTLRVALLLIIVLVGLVLLVVVGLGFEGALFLVGLGATMKLLQRRLMRTARP